MIARARTKTSGRKPLVAAETIIRQTAPDLLDAAEAAGSSFHASITVRRYANGQRKLVIRKLFLDSDNVAIRNLDTQEAIKRVMIHCLALEQIDHFDFAREIISLEEFEISQQVLTENHTINALTGRIRDSAQSGFCFNIPTATEAWLRHRTWLVIAQGKTPDIRLPKRRKCLCPIDNSPPRNGDEAP